jgi:bifunctional non-homologous end joining protein LigD
VFYPETGFTKGDVINYYIQISDVLLPHVKDRALTLKRYPDGVDGGFFYEKRCPSYRPNWVKTAPIWSERHGENIHYCLPNDLPSLVWAANLGDIEIHTSLSLAKTPEQPAMMVFDLDPGPPANILHCAQAALWLKKELDASRLECFPKTSGSKGLQVYVPLNSPATYAATKTYSHSLAERLEREHPELMVSRMEKRLREGKVLVDWSQNDRHKTTVCVYSLRARPLPTASTPVEWKEVRAALQKKDSGRLTFLSNEVLRRARERGDLFEPVLKLRQRLPKSGA